MRASELLTQIRGMHASPERDARIVRAALDGSLVTWPWCQVPLPDGRGYFEAAADYVSIGEGHDWVRVPLGGPAYQLLADELGAVLPSSYMVELIWRASPVKLKPQPFQDLTAMTSTPRFYEHHGLIEQQRAGRGGVTPQELISGQKKDLVVSNRLVEYPNAVCIFGWYSPDGKFIQTTSTKHKEYWYSDYSHGGRLVRKEMVLDGQRVLVDEVLRDPTRAALLTGGNAFAVQSQGPDQVLRVTRYQIPDQLRQLVGRATTAPSSPSVSKPAAGTLGERAADVCAAELRAGVAESPPGSGTSPRIREYFAPGRRRDTEVLLKLTAGDWCAAAQSWAAAQAARPGETVPHGYRVSVLELTFDAQANGAWRPVDELRSGRYQLRRGDLVCFRRPTSESWTGHVARVDVPPDGAGRFVALSANSGNAWARPTYSLSDPNLTGAIAYPTDGAPSAAARPPASTPAPAVASGVWARWAPARPEPRGAPADTILAVPGIERLPDAAKRGLLDLCDELGMPVDSLAAVMASESGFCPWIINGVQRDGEGRGVKVNGQYVLSKANQDRVKNGRQPFFAVGLIQLTLGAFLPGFDTNERLLAVADWSAEDQVAKVVRPFYKRMGTAVRGADPGKVYMLNFLPKFAGSDPNTVIGDRESSDSFTRAVYAQNAGFDRDQDGKITVADVQEAAARQVRAAKGRVAVAGARPAPAPSGPTVPAHTELAPVEVPTTDRTWFVQSPGARALIRSTSARSPQAGTTALAASVRRRGTPTVAAQVDSVIATTATGWGSSDDLKAYMTALKSSVDALYGIVMGNVGTGDLTWKGQFTTWAHLFYSWYQEHIGDWWARDETWQTATAFHLRYLEWRKSAKEQGFNTNVLGPEPDPQKAQELEKALKEGGASPWAETVQIALGAGTGLGLLFGLGYLINAAGSVRRR